VIDIEAGHQSWLVHYQTVLDCLIAILDRAGETYHKAALVNERRACTNRPAIPRERWLYDAPALQHLWVGNASGTFQDRILTPLNGDPLTPSQESCVDAMFQRLKDIGRVAALAVYDPAALHNLTPGTWSSSLTTWVCLACGGEYVGESDIRHVAAARWANRTIREIFTGNHGQVLVDQSFQCEDAPAFQVILRETHAAVQALGLPVLGSSDDLGPTLQRACPHCGAWSPRGRSWQAIEEPSIHFVRVTSS
jgi:hypothetical protein